MKCVGGRAFVGLELATTVAVGIILAAGLGAIAKSIENSNK